MQGPVEAVCRSDGDGVASADRREQAAGLVCVTTADRRAVAAGLAGLPGIESVEISDEGVLVETRDPTALALALPELAVATNAQLRSIEPTDEDLESVYGYLTERARGTRR